MEEIKMSYEGETDKEDLGSSSDPHKNDGKNNVDADQKPLMVHGCVPPSSNGCSMLASLAEIRLLQEDDRLIELVGKQGNKKWSEIAKHLPGRIGKQCRERWWNNLNPDINKAPWTKEEEMILIHAHSVYGNRWSEISKLIPGRTENSVKNHWNCSLKKKLGNYLAYASTLNHAEAIQNGSTNCSIKERVGFGRNEDSCRLDLVLGSSGDSSSCATTNQTVVLDGTHGPPYLDSPLYTGRDNTNLTIRNNVGKPGESSSDRSYTGLCYEPIKRADLNNFLSTGKFPGIDSYIHSQSRLDMKSSPDSYISLESMLRNAAVNYDKVPSIIRKRAIKTLPKGSSTPEKVPEVDDDQSQGSGKNIVKFVGKCLEQAFSDA
ncbi:hypothetical protein BUALT_Bualt01G0222800 [Buddleja alternifolia]|uniref:Uncharacterized protein n=1 Tax=Buddleja alternifolia TaxID=168488 RepID=A0AAV6YF15_9LAMI|nr:hypothetical protein BUALT_Bualt01G0222800 [Buddleja alternifolia]